MTEIIEIRLRRVRETRPWKHIEPILARVDSTLFANRIAKALLAGYMIVEVRWNILGSLQRHYFSRKEKT